MRKIITILLVLSAGMANAQVYKGKGDTKFQVGANFQDGASGINVTADFGIGKNMSYGFSATYLLSADKIIGIKPKFEDRIDAKARFNAHLADVLGIEDKFDLYPGLDLGLRNFGAHFGARYFFTDGIGVYTEAGFPIAKYDTHVSGFEYYNNQFTINAGLSFNL